MLDKGDVKVFTLEEANGLLPRLRRAVGELRQIRSEILRLQAKLEVLNLIHGDAVREPGNVDYHEYLAQRRNLRGLIRAFNDVVEEINSTGAVLKDPQHGLIDFYGEVDGNLVFLCWKPDEDSILYWHPIEGSYATRQPLGGFDIPDTDT